MTGDAPDASRDAATSRKRRTIRDVHYDPAMLNRVTRTLAALLSLALLGAWGRDGHAIIAEIAVREMTPAARTRAAEILAGQELPAIASWADQVRPQGAYRWTAPMHYVNLPEGTKAYDHAEHCPDEGCVVSAVYDFSRLVVDDVDQRTREDALKFLVHFVGDLHQPLHAGRPDDRGGNDVETTFLGRARNLHSVWDSGVLNAGDPEAWPLIADRLWNRIDDQDRLAWLADADRDDLIATAGRWVFESHRLAERFAYTVGPGAVLDEGYVGRCLPVVHLRLQQGGVRLGALLNQLLDPGSQGLDWRPAPPAPAPEPGPE